MTSQEKLQGLLKYATTKKVMLVSPEFSDVSSPSSVSNKVSNSVLSKGTKLNLIYESSCLEQRNSNSELIDQFQIFMPQAFDTSIWSIDVELPTDMNLSEVEDLANQDSCLQQVGHAVQYRLSMIPDDPYYTSSSGSLYQKHIPAIKAETAWDTFYGSQGIQDQVIVAVLDSGLDYNHPDIVNRVWKDASGKVGHNAVDRSKTTMDEGSACMGHGTHVAGLIAAEMNNSIGTTGVAGQKVKIMPIKIGNLNSDGSDCVITTAQINNGLSFAIDNQVDVINMSLGGQYSGIGSGKNLYPSTTAALIRKAISNGIAIVAAAGNGDDEGIGFDININPFYPASMAKDLPGLISVGALSADTSLRPTFSNFSSTIVKIAAPGTQTNSKSSCSNNGSNATCPDGLLSLGIKDSFKFLEGTSMATPVVTAAVALSIAYAKTYNMSTDPAITEIRILNSSKKVSALSNAFKNGNTLDLNSLANYMVNEKANGGSFSSLPPCQ